MRLGFQIAAGALTVLAIISSVGAENPATTQAADGLKEYVDPGKLFSFKHPTDWQEAKVRGVSIAAVEPVDQTPASFSIAAHELPATADVHAIMPAVEQQLAVSMKKFTLISDKNTKLAGLEANRMEYTAESNNLLMHMVQFYVIDGKELYVVSGGVVDSRQADFGELFDELAKEFKILKH